MTSLTALRDRLAVARAGERSLPLHPAFGELLPVVQRGATVGCSGSAAVSLALAVVGQPSTDGLWVCVAGLPTLNARAADENGVALNRLVVVQAPPAGFDDTRWGEIVAAAIDGFDVVLVGPALHRVRPSTTRRLQARAQSRGAVLVVVHHERGAFTPDVVLRSERVHWQGLGQGHGVVQQRRVEVVASGRRLPRERRSHLVWPLDHSLHHSLDHSLDHSLEVVDDVALRRTG
jgi:hypothetical protein